MVAPLALIFMTQWMLLITQLCVGWHCTDCINGSAIENFSCAIYNISLMNCSWQAGKDAPGDTQYFLYWQNSRYDDVMECELYIKDENGRNTGCRFQNVRIETEKTYFLVNGSSKDSLIQSYDAYIQLYKIEKLMPPANITVNCDEIKNNCIIQWQRPQISHSNKDKCFKYKIDIKYKSFHRDREGARLLCCAPKRGNRNCRDCGRIAANDHRVADGDYKGKPACTIIRIIPREKTSILLYKKGEITTFQRYNTRKKCLLQMRAAGSVCFVNSAWGEWSEPVEFGNEEVSSSVWILLVVAVGTLLVAIVAILVCKRTGCWKAAFLQVPEPKNAFCGLPDNTELMESKIQSITSDKEEITLVADILK